MDRLAAVAESCRQAGADVATNQCDVTDRTGMSAWIAAESDRASLDLVIANAGISGGPGDQPADAAGAEPSRAIFAVNLDGVLNTLEPALAAMRRQGHGQIAVIASLAALRGLPTAPAYSASKTAARSYAEALQGPAQQSGVDIRTVLPGFIHTPLTANNLFPMPGAMRADQAAERVASGLAGHSYRIAFPIWLYLATLALTALPERVLVPLLSRLPAKN